MISFMSEMITKIAMNLNTIPSKHILLNIQEDKLKTILNEV